MQTARAASGKRRHIDTCRQQVSNHELRAINFSFGTDFIVPCKISIHCVFIFAQMVYIFTLTWIEKCFLSVWGINVYISLISFVIPPYDFHSIRVEVCFMPMVVLTYIPWALWWMCILAILDYLIYKYWLDSVGGECFWGFSIVLLVFYLCHS